MKVRNYGEYLIEIQGVLDSLLQAVKFSLSQLEDSAIFDYSGVAGALRQSNVIIADLAEETTHRIEVWYGRKEQRSRTKARSASSGS